MVLIMAAIAIMGIVKSSKFGNVYLRGNLTIREGRKKMLVIVIIFIFNCRK